MRRGTRSGGEIFATTAIVFPPDLVPLFPEAHQKLPPPPYL